MFRGYVICRNTSLKQARFKIESLAGYAPSSLQDVTRLECRSFGYCSKDINTLGMLLQIKTLVVETVTNTS